MTPLLVLERFEHSANLARLIESIHGFLLLQ
jgi:hypothetical protein